MFNFFLFIKLCLLLLQDNSSRGKSFETICFIAEMMMTRVNANLTGRIVIAYNHDIERLKMNVNKVLTVKLDFNLI